MELRKLYGLQQADDNIVAKCRNYTQTTIPSIDHPFVSCYYVLPPPTAALDLDNPWGKNVSTTQPISICATAFNATVKEVQFEYSRTSEALSLEDLTVVDVVQKPDTRDEDRPLWGTENLGAGWNIEEISLQWGIVSEPASKSAGGSIRTIRSRDFPLPLYAPGDSSYGWGDTMVR